VSIKQIVPVLRVVDVARSISWYGEMLGFVGDPFPAAPPHEFAILRHDETELMLRRSETAQRARHRRYDWDVYLRIDGDIVKMYGEMSERGVVSRRLERMFYGLAEFEVTDPDGYSVCVSAEAADAEDLPRPAA